MAVIVRHYDNPHTAQEAVEQLGRAGIAQNRIGFLTSQGVRGRFHVPNEVNPNDMSRAEGLTLGTLAGMVTAAMAMATPFGPLLAAGPLFGTLVGALAGAATGGAVASLIETGISREMAHALAATLENDEALLLSVEVPNERAAEIRDLLAQGDALHADELRYFATYHELHQEASFAEFNDAYHYGYRAASESQRPYAEAEAALRLHYPGDFERDQEAVRVGYQRYLDTVQVVGGAAEG